MVHPSIQTALRSAETCTGSIKLKKVSFSLCGLPAGGGHMSCVFVYSLALRPATHHGIQPSPFADCRAVDLKKPRVFGCAFLLAENEQLSPLRTFGWSCSGSAPTRRRDQANFRASAVIEATFCTFLFSAARETFLVHMHRRFFSCVLFLSSFVCELAFK